MVVSAIAIESRKAKVLATQEAMRTWPHWNEVFLNCAKESPLSFEAFAQAVQTGDASREAFEQALRNSRMTQEAFQTFLPEYIKFMALQVAYKDVGMLSDGVDQLWHAHMLITRRYEAFCQRYLGFVLGHLPCSSYELYGVTVLEAGDSCLAKCNPTTCKNEGGGGGCKRAPDEQEDRQAIQHGILQSARLFVEAYTEVFDASPSLEIWNQLSSTRRFATI